MSIAWRKALRASVFAAAVVAMTVGFAGCLVSGIALARGRGPESVFPGTPLASGARLSGQIRVTPADRTLTPYVRVQDVRDSCQTQCFSDAPALSDLLQVRAQAPDGTSWVKPLGALTAFTRLTGGDLSPTSQPREYQLSASLPRDVSNSGEGLTTSFVLLWGLMDAQGRPVTKVLGESFGRSPGQGSRNHELPFTGSDVILELAAAASVLFVGVTLIRAARRRLRV